MGTIIGRLLFIVLMLTIAIVAFVGHPFGPYPQKADSTIQVAIPVQAVVPAIKAADFRHEVLTLTFAEAPDWSAGLVSRVGYLDPGAKPTVAYPGCDLNLIQVSTSAKDPKVAFFQARQVPDYLEMTLHNSTAHLTRLYRLSAKDGKVQFEEVGKP